jgi:CcmD family protein
MRRAISALILALSLAFGSAPARAQAPAPPSVEASAQPADASQALRTQVQTLPQAPAPPRTMRAYWHLFAAFTFGWLAIFGYTISLSRRFKRLEQQLDALGGERPAV